VRFPPRFSPTWPAGAEIGPHGVALAGAALVLAGLALLALRSSPSRGVRARPAEAAA
jgi:hypothetical protein